MFTNIDYKVKSYSETSISTNFVTRYEMGSWIEVNYCLRVDAPLLLLLVIYSMLDRACVGRQECLRNHEIVGQRFLHDRHTREINTKLFLAFFYKYST